MTVPMFSIVTVCLNDKNGLIGTDKSIRSQTISDYEWIVIDGASRDGTKELLEQLPVGHCHWISEPDKSLYDAMNKGIDIATGEYLIFLNSADELASDDVLDRVKDALSSARPSIAYGDSFERTINGNLLQKKARHHSFIWYGMFTHHQAMFYRRDLVQATRYNINYKIGADLAMTVNILKQNGEALMLGFPICVFLQGGLSSTEIGRARKELWQIQRDEIGMSFTMRSIMQFGQLCVQLFKKLIPRIYQMLRYK